MLSLPARRSTMKEYDKELKKLQSKLSELHNRLYRKRIPVIITYEGWDAAGKGGNIKRITGALDPRGYEVHPIASPEPHEKPAIICGVSGRDFQRTVISQFLTVPGMDASWWSDWKDSAVKMTGNALTMK